MIRRAWFWTKLGVGMALTLGIELFGCAPHREPCYLSKDARADQLIQERCIAKGFKWSDCPEREDILADLEEAYAACP